MNEIDTIKDLIAKKQYRKLFLKIKEIEDLPSLFCQIDDFISVKVICRILIKKYFGVSSVLNATDNQKIRSSISTISFSRDEALEIGSLLHLRIKQYLSNELTTDCPTKVIPYRDSIRSIILEVKSHPVIEVELPVIHPHKYYSGIIDCLTNNDNGFQIYEWKTSKKDRYLFDLEEHKIQCAAYVHAFESAYKKDIEKVFICYAFPDSKGIKIEVSRKDIDASYEKWLLRLDNCWLPGKEVNNPDGTSFIVKTIPEVIYRSKEMPIISYFAHTYSSKDSQEWNDIVSRDSFLENLISKIESNSEKTKLVSSILDQETLSLDIKNDKLQCEINDLDSFFQYTYDPIELGRLAYKSDFEEIYYHKENKDIRKNNFNQSKLSYFHPENIDLGYIDPDEIYEGW